MEARKLTPQSKYSTLDPGAGTATVGDIMVTEVITTEADSSLLLVDQLLEQNGIHHVLVAESDRLMGVISDRDVLSALSPFLATEAEDYRDVRTMHLRASEIMTPDPICVTPNTTIAQAAVLLLRHSISCLPVTKVDHTIQGIVTWKDLLWFYLGLPKNGAATGH